MQHPVRLRSSLRIAGSSLGPISCLRAGGRGHHHPPKSLPAVFDIGSPVPFSASQGLGAVAVIPVRGGGTWLQA